MMRGFGVTLTAFAMLTAAIATTAAVPQTPADRIPVVVELFTSEGCSSCPPADALLSRIAKEPIPGAQVIPLGLHVTYWDQLGWKDPASLQSATERQQQYGAIWGGDRVYTPQAVVDGREELVGSDEARLRRAIAEAVKRPHVALTLAATADGDRISATLGVTSQPPNLTERLDATFFLTEDGLSSIVKRGENGGRTLYHDAVVRLQQRVDRVEAAGPVPIVVRGLRPEWRRDRLRAVVVLAGHKSHQVVGAAAAPLR